MLTSQGVSRVSTVCIKGANRVLTECWQNVNSVICTGC